MITTVLQGCERIELLQSCKVRNFCENTITSCLEIENFCFATAFLMIYLQSPLKKCKFRTKSPLEKCQTFD